MGRLADRDEPWRERGACSCSARSASRPHDPASREHLHVRIEDSHVCVWVRRALNFVLVDVAGCARINPGHDECTGGLSALVRCNTQCDLAVTRRS